MRRFLSLLCGLLALAALHAAAAAPHTGRADSLLSK